MIQGVGVGLRTPHLQDSLNWHQDIPWLELLADNWLTDGGLDRYLLSQIAERHNLTLHGVGLSLGSPEPLDFDYLARIKQLKHDTKAAWYSEHCSFSGLAGTWLPDLLPLPYTEQALHHLAERIHQVQDFLGERILLENVSSYITCTHSQMNEAQFLQALVDLADCDLLLDINNAFVSAYNLGGNPLEFCLQLPPERIREIHLAGHQVGPDHLLDSHNQPVCEDVWQLYRDYTSACGAVPTLIEWDHDLPKFEILWQEQQKATHILGELAA